MNSFYSVLGHDSRKPFRSHQDKKGNVNSTIKSVVLLLLSWLIMLKLTGLVLNPGVIHKPPPRTESGTLLCL